jgi:tetratricopeptide (TPR) repeat protein
LKTLRLAVSVVVLLSACSTHAPVPKAASPAVLEGAPLPISDTAALLRQDMLYTYQFRAGDYATARKSLALLGPAVEASPRDTTLLNAYGQAWLREGTASFATNPAGAISASQRAMIAFESVLLIDPDNAAALSTRGSLRTVLGFFQSNTNVIGQGVADMDRAIALAPNSHPVRLTRAFSGFNLPRDMRNTANETEDLVFLAWTAAGTRQGAMVSILLGDTYAEAGETIRAREAYTRASAPDTPAASLALARLQALANGRVAATDIASLRRSTGRDCAMCHAP